MADLAVAAYLAALLMMNLAHNMAQYPTPPTERQWLIWCEAMRENLRDWDAGSSAVHQCVQDASLLG